MQKITIVCSGHRESGRCSADELLNILRSLGPQVIFVEVRPSDIDSFYKSKSSLEAQAITKYRDFKSFEIVPVDQYDMLANALVEFRRDFDRVLDCVARASQEYQLLNEENNKNVYYDGFRYLNSVPFAERSARMSEIEGEIIRGTDNQDLIQVLEKWRHRIHRREVEMVRNIYYYCRKNVFDIGVFLVGAAHKTDIIKQIEKYAPTKSELINWNLAYDGRIP